MFWFLLLTMVVVVSAVTLAVVGGGKNAVLQDVAPERLTDPLPATRAVGRADVEALRLPVTLRGYRMTDVDDALDRLGAELAERDARIAELESALAGAQATAVGGPGLLKRPEDGPHPEPERPEDGPRFAPERPEDDPHPEPERSEDRSRTPWDASWQDEPPQHEPPQHQPRRHEPRQHGTQQHASERTEHTGEEPRR